MSVIFLFIDGVGMGTEKKSNPFHRHEFKGFSAMSGGQPFNNTAEDIIQKDHIFKKIDTTLEVEGLPQSGTGQTALFTGENAPQLIGKHFGPYPHSGIKHLLTGQSIFHKAQTLQNTCRFMNAYPDIFFRKAEKKNRWSCTTLMTKHANIPLHTVKEVKQGKALTAEITQQAWRKQLNIQVPEISPEEAAQRMLEQTKHFDLMLHEYYLTDKAGHSQEMQQAIQYLQVYDRFLEHLIRHKYEDTTIVLSSDHGNIEDLAVKTHTFQPVPLYVYGPGATYFTNAKSIMDVTPSIIKALQ